MKKLKKKDMEFAFTEFSSCYSFLLDICEVCLILFWCFLKLVPWCIDFGPLRRDFVQTNVRCCLCMALDDLFEAISDP